MLSTSNYLFAQIFMSHTDASFYDLVTISEKYGFSSQYRYKISNLYNCFICLCFSSEWELISYVILEIAGLYHLFGQAFMFKGLGEALTEFTTTYTEISSQLPINELSVYRKVFRRILFLKLMVLPMMVNTFLYYGFYLYNKELTRVQSIMISTPKMISECLTFVPPTTGGILVLQNCYPLNLSK